MATVGWLVDFLFGFYQLLEIIIEHQIHFYTNNQFSMSTRFVKNISISSYSVYSNSSNSDNSFLSLRVFGLLSSSLLFFPRIFRQLILR